MSKFNRSTRNRREIGGTQPPTLEPVNLRTFQRATIGWRLAAAAMAVVLLAACGAAGTTPTTEGPATAAPTSGGAATPGGERLSVVTTLTIFVSMVEAVGGDRVTASSIVPPGVDPHTYQPTPSDARRVADADLILVNGLGLEEWLAGLLGSAGADVPRYTLSEGVTPGTGTPTPAAEAHDHPEGDPHLWLDPTLAEGYVANISRALSERDPANAATYQANADAYIAEIRDMDTWAREQMAAIPADRRKIVTFHDAYGHFAAHYGLDVIGVVTPSPGQEPSAQQVAQLTDEIRAQGVPAIFLEPQFNPQLGETLAREAGVQTYTLYSDTPPEGVGYVEMMRTNVEHVVEGLTS